MTLTRRKTLALGAGAAIAVPAALQGRWLAKDFSVDQPPAPMPTDGARVWRNWSGLHSATPREIFTPTSEDELAAKIAAWPGRVRPVGSGHSFIDIVPTEDLMVDASRLSGLIDADPQAGTATFGAGTRLRQAAMEADAEGLAFPNLPDIDVQTLAGSFSTATHGTGRDLPALHARLRGFRLLTPSGEFRDVTRESDPDLFAAGQVSLGTLGILTQVTLDMAPRFALNRKVFLVPLDEAIETMHERAAQHPYFEFYVLPHTGYCALITHDHFDGEPEGRAPSKDEDFISTFKTLRDVLGWAPWLRKKAFETYVKTQVDGSGLIEDETDLSWKLLSTARATKMHELEYHLPAEEVQDALREVVAAMESRPDTFFPMEVRFIATDDAWLSPFQGGPRCSIAVHTAQNETHQTLFDLAEPILRAHGGRPHWGKLHSLSAEQLAGLYPRFGDFQAVRAQIDPEGKMLNPRTAALFGVPFEA
ncbi:MAG: oxidoreductase, FAD-binding protein [Rhodobacterales bacterium]|nr:MAG: oxidoreductase, FAD-binding protein [Rhodobacterales bacterium]